MTILLVTSPAGEDTLDRGGCGLFVEAFLAQPVVETAADTLLHSVSGVVAATLFMRAM